MTAKRPPKKAPAKAGAEPDEVERPRLRWMDEIRLMYNARVYGEVEPLLQCLEQQGLQQAEARRFVADLARKAPRKRGAQRTQAAEDRDIRIGYIVANRMGLLVRAGSDPRKAFAEVAHELQLRGDGLGDKQVKRIWQAVSAAMPFLFRGPYRMGRDEAFRHPLYPDM